MRWTNSARYKENLRGAWDFVGMIAQHVLEYELEDDVSNTLSVSDHEAFARCMRGGLYKRRDATRTAPIQLGSSSSSGGILYE